MLFTINLLQGAVSFQFSPDAAQTLRTEMDQLMLSMRAIATTAASSNRPDPQKTMEYRYTGDIFLEIFCNPNIYPSPFAAKVLMTLRDDRLRITSEASLSQLLEDLDNYLVQS